MRCYVIIIQSPGLSPSGWGLVLGLALGGTFTRYHWPSSGKLDFYFLVLLALFLLATSKKSSLRKKY